MPSWTGWKRSSPATARDGGAKKKGRFDPAQSGVRANSRSGIAVSGLPERLGAFAFGRLRIQPDVAQQMRVQRGQLAALMPTQGGDADDIDQAGKNIAAATKGKGNLGLGQLCLL